MPEDLHRKLKVRAAIEGVSMSQFVIREIERSLERPSRQEVLDAISRQPDAVLDEVPTDVVREGRNSR